MRFARCNAQCNKKNTMIQSQSEKRLTRIARLTLDQLV
ncbi:hypothetical protein OJF2_24990 [Aquisphaera giovannonii]|uniref:Uncharacterized protein n=1 Tax=Aquisphaera giovannonii TaxID=406548 RepID=A0A5B9VZV5_9BACT|nr:hypothetical protein OJF2_24990 [Aquisphaera giovannonii]